LSRSAVPKIKIAADGAVGVPKQHENHHRQPQKHACAAFLNQFIYLIV
jgi:hypothetical protein